MPQRIFCAAGSLASPARFPPALTIEPLPLTSASTRATTGGGSGGGSPPGGGCGGGCVEQLKRRVTAAKRPGPKVNVYGEPSPPVQPGGADVWVIVIE